MSLLLVILSLSSLVQHAHSQVPFGGACPTNISKQMDNYTAPTYQGMWYLQAGVPTILDQNKKCIAFNFTTSGGLTAFTKYVVDMSTEMVSTYIGSMIVDHNSDYVNLQYRIPLQYAMTIQLLGGDMVNYVIVYFCSTNGFYTYDDGGIHPFIYTRDKNPSCVIMETAYAELESNHIPRSFLKLIDQRCSDF